MKNMLSKFREPIDMTKGNPLNNIILFMIPMLIGNVAQQLYNTVDSIIVGRYIGDDALAAVGSAGPLINLLLVLFVGISVGASIMVSQYFGAKDRDNLSGTIGCCVLLTSIASIILMITVPFIIKPILRLLNTPESIIDWCYSYLLIIFLGIAGMAYYNILCGVIRGLGDSISPLKYLLIATLLNIVLDFCFVAYLDMGVAGVALATVIAQIVSSVFCFIKLSRMSNIFDFGLSYMRWNIKHVKTTIKLGLPSGLTQMIFSLAMIIIQSLTNSYGKLFIAANVIVMRVDGFAMMPNFSFGTAMTTFAGQNVGAKRYDRVKRGSKEGTIFALFVSAVITILLLIFGKNLMSVFTDTVELVDLSMRMMRILALGYLAMAITQCLSGVMRGAGDSMTPMWISLITTVIVRVPVAYGLAWLTKTPSLPNGKCSSVFISLLVSWIVGSLLTILLFKRGKWKDKAI